MIRKTGLHNPSTQGPHTNAVTHDRGQAQHNHKPLTTAVTPTYSRTMVRRVSEVSGVPDIQLVPEADSTDLRYTIRGHDRDRVSPEC